MLQFNKEPSLATIQNTTMLAIYVKYRTDTYQKKLMLDQIVLFYSENTMLNK